MTKWLVIAAVLVVAACKKDEVDASLAELATLRDKMCACKDRACADTVNDEVGAFMKRDRERFDRMPEDKKKQSLKLEDEQYQCWKNLKQPE
jgi:hypothetical protein